MVTSPFASPTVPDPIGTELSGVIRRTATNLPRNRQETIGPSEMGDECDRRLAMKLWGVPAVSDFSDPWPSIVGTATHTWLADAFRAENSLYALPRWIVEQKVYPDDAHPGSCDLYDVHRAGVLDWKILGTTSMKKYKAQGPSTRYIVQSHLYGLGFRRLGFNVKTVSIVMLPRGGMLAGIHVWTAAYDEAVALKALARVGDIACSVYDVADRDEIAPAEWESIPATPSTDCAYCPYKRPGPVDGTGCPGEVT
mgnify:CR=1 FL=1